MKCYFIRHAKAGYNAPSDTARPLTDEGRSQAQSMATALHRIGTHPTTIFCSPRVRAQQTATILGDAFGVSPVIDDACNFDFNLRKAQTLLDGLAVDARVFFVGHNPSMSEIVGEIAGAAVDLPTCAVVYINGVHPDSVRGAALKWVLTPKIVDALLTG